MLTASAEHGIEIFDAVTREFEYGLKSDGISRVTSLSLSPDASILVAGDDTGNIFRWDLKTLREITPPIEAFDKRILKLELADNRQGRFQIVVLGQNQNTNTGAFIADRIRVIDFRSGLDRVEDLTLEDKNSYFKDFAINTDRQGNYHPQR